MVCIVERVEGRESRAHASPDLAATPRERSVTRPPSLPPILAAAEPPLAAAYVRKSQDAMVPADSSAASWPHAAALCNGHP